MKPFTRLSRAFTVAYLLGLMIGIGLVMTLYATDQPATNGFPILLNQQAALNTTGVMGAGTMSRCRATAVYIQWGPGTTAGGITVETAHDQNYTGTWAALGSAVAWSVANKEDVVQITGINGAIRTRISTLVTGGTVSTWIVCN